MRKWHSFHNICELVMSEERFLTAGRSPFKKPRWLDSEDMASHINWARRVTINGRGASEKRAYDVPF